MSVPPKYETQRDSEARAAAAAHHLANGVELRIRPAVSTDVAYMTKCYLEGMRDQPAARRVIADVFYVEERKVFERLLNEATVLVATSKNDLDYVLGYLVAEASDAGPVLHWCYVRHNMRRMGVARALVETFCAGQEGTRWFTRWTATGHAALGQHDTVCAQRAGYTFNPYLAAGVKHA